LICWEPTTRIHGIRALSPISFSRKGTDIALRKKLDEIADKEFGEALRYYKLTLRLPLQPLAEIHLSSHYQQEYEVNGDKTVVYLLFAIALLIIGIAWVNYINLSTARSLTRAKEVGLRKVVGASRPQLMRQFFMETILINLFAVILTLLLLEFLLPYFSTLTDTPNCFASYIRNIPRYGVFCWPACFVDFIRSLTFSAHARIVQLGNKIKMINLRKVLVLFSLPWHFACSITFAIFRQILF
jgi:ABC-type antimicrobial peptide transport system permease subunit